MLYYSKKGWIKIATIDNIIMKAFKSNSWTFIKLVQVKLRVHNMLLT